MLNLIFEFRSSGSLIEQTINNALYSKKKLFKNPGFFDHGIKYAFLCERYVLNITPKNRYQKKGGTALLVLIQYWKKMGEKSKVGHL